MRRYDPNDRESVDEARLDASLQVQTDQLALKEILQLKSGRRLIWKYLSYCGVFKTSFHPSGSQVYFNEGRRDVGLMILGEMTNADPDAFLQMMKENKQE